MSVVTVPRACLKCKGSGFPFGVRCGRCGGRGCSQSAYLHAMKVDTAWWGPLAPNYAEPTPEDQTKEGT